MTTKDLLTLYDDLAGKAWQRMIEMIGTHAVIILAQRAAWLARQQYAEAELIDISDTGVTFGRLEITDPGIAKIVAEEFISSLVSILTRLVGPDIAAKLALEIQESSNQQGVAPGGGKP